MAADAPIAIKQEPPADVIPTLNTHGGLANRRIKSSFSSDQADAAAHLGQEAPAEVILTDNSYGSSTNRP